MPTPGRVPSQSAWQRARRCETKSVAPPSERCNLSPRGIRGRRSIAGARASARSVPEPKRRAHCTVRRDMGPVVKFLSWALILGSALVQGCAGGIPASLHIPRGTATEQVAELRSTEETKRLVQELAVAGSRGVVESLSEEETTARLRVFVEGMTRALMADLRSALEGLQPATRQLTEELVTTAVRGAASELSRTMAPALRQMIVDLLKDPELRQSLGGVGRELGKDLVLGSTDALHAAEARSKKTPMGWLAKAFASSAVLLGAGVLLIVGLPVGLLLRLRAKSRREREEADRRASIAASILRSIESADADSMHRLLDAVADTLSPPPTRLRRAVASGGGEASRDAVRHSRRSLRHRT